MNSYGALFRGQFSYFYPDPHENPLAVRLCGIEPLPIWSAGVAVGSAADFADLCTFFYIILYGGRSDLALDDAFGGDIKANATNN
jgi:hypothetical protein